LDHRNIIDTACRAALGKLGGEISALLGQDCTCSDIRLELTTRDRLLSEQNRSRTTLTRMTVSGDRPGESYLLCRVSAATLLGGTLILLPREMIDKQTGTGELDGELKDAFGEVTHIIARVLTRAFADHYPAAIHFAATAVATLAPAPDPVADSPFPPGNYYLASCRIGMADSDLGPLELVVPAALLDLEDKRPETPLRESEPQEQPSEQTAASSPSTRGPTTDGKAFPGDRKQLTDGIFHATMSQIEEELGILLGQELTCDDLRLSLISKAEFFSHHCPKQAVLTRLQVTGDEEGLGFMVTGVADAVIMGGTLIMLPEDELDEQQKSGRLDGEVADAYGEIVKLLAGSLTRAFRDRSPWPLRLIKGDAEILVPGRVARDSDQPLPEGNYYLASFAVHLDGHELNRLQLLFPAEILGLDMPLAGSARFASGPADLPVTGGGETEGADSGPSPSGGTPLVLVMSDQPGHAAPFVDTLTAAGYQCRVLSFQQDLRGILQQHRIQGIFLIMSQVGDKGFAAAIKLQSAGRPLPPLIFAGPQWTRSAVLCAVKYGARDILMTPARDPGEGYPTYEKSRLKCVMRTELNQPQLTINVFFCSPLTAHRSRVILNRQILLLDLFYQGGPLQV